MSNIFTFLLNFFIPNCKQIVTTISIPDDKQDNYLSIYLFNLIYHSIFELFTLCTYSK